WGEGVGVSARVSAAREQSRLPGHREVAGVRIPSGAYERGWPRRAVSYSGRAAAVLRGADARRRTADDHDSNGEKGESAGIHRRHPDGTDGKAARRASDDAETAFRGNRSEERRVGKEWRSRWAQEQ